MGARKKQPHPTSPAASAAASPPTIGAEADRGGDALDATQLFLAAASAGDLRTVRRLLAEEGVDVHAVDAETDATAIDLAVYGGHEPVARCLVVEFGADPTRRGFHGLTALEMAARVGHETAARTHLKDDPRRLRASAVDAGTAVV
jgi:ankyrin repeat protein